MPFINDDGFRVPKGARRTDERTVTSVGTATVDVDVEGLVAVEGVVDVSINDEQVDESGNLTAEESSISGNTVSVQVFSGDGSGGISAAADGDVTDATITVTAAGY